MIMLKIDFSKNFKPIKIKDDEICLAQSKANICEKQKVFKGNSVIFLVQFYISNYFLIQVIIFKSPNGGFSKFGGRFFRSAKQTR